MRLLIVNSHLETGGIRQSLLNMLENIDDIKLDIDLQLLKYDDKLVKQYEQLKGVKVLPPIRILNAYYTSFSQQKGFIDRFFKIMFCSLSKILGGKRITNLMMYFVPKSNRYDVAISFSNDIWASHVGGFYGGCNDFVINRTDAKKKIAWIHNEPQRLGFTYEISKYSYKDFDSIVNVSYSCKKKFDEIIPEYKFKSKVVYNMFDIERVRRLSSEENPYKKVGFHVVTVARLDNQQKRIDRIINCCEKLKLDGITNFQWHIVGAGPDRDRLMSLSKEKGTNDIVVFEGRKDNPYPYMKYADIFVLTSDYEAYGMVLIESIIAGTPVISTNFPAACEVINKDKNGIIVEINEESVFNAVKMVIKTPHLIRQMEDYIKSNEISNELALKQFKDILGE